MQGFVVLAFFLVLLTIAVYGIGERSPGPATAPWLRSSSPRLPGVANFSGHIVFALPAAALMACAVLLAAASRTDAAERLGDRRGCRDRRDAPCPDDDRRLRPRNPRRRRSCRLACRPGSGLRRGLLNLGLLCVAAFAVAAPWYLPNFDLRRRLPDRIRLRRTKRRVRHLPLDRLLGSLDRRLREDRRPRTSTWCSRCWSSSAWRPSWSTAVRRVAGAEDRGAALRDLLASDASVVAIVAACRLRRAVLIPQRRARVHTAGQRPSRAAGGACAAQAPAGCRTRRRRIGRDRGDQPHRRVHVLGFALACAGGRRARASAGYPLVDGRADFRPTDPRPGRRARNPLRRDGRRLPRVPTMSLPKPSSPSSTPRWSRSGLATGSSTPTR